jgi:polyhydroxyalkanoate synthase
MMPNQFTAPAFFAAGTAADLMGEVAAFNTKVAAGIRNLGAIRDDEIAIATTPKDLVLKVDKITLHRYRPLADQRISTPVLIVYSLIGRHTMTDLQEDRSLIRNLLRQGLDVWVVDWGNASRADKYLTIDDYVLGYLDDCVEAMCRETGVAAIDLLGICEGGVFTLAYSALEPERIKNLVLTVTPLDFHADQREEKLEHGFLNVWTRSLTTADVDRMIEVWGVLPGDFMSAIFSMLTPIRSMTKYNLDLLDVVDDEAKLRNYLRMEKWLADRPHHAGEAAKQWLKDFYQDNKLINNQLELGGRKVDLRNVTMPVLNIYAQDDHIIPPPTSRALEGKVGTSDYTELGLPGGHIGVFVSGKSQGIVGKGIVDWLAERDS